jgi:hypothetical protein
MTCISRVVRSFHNQTVLVHPGNMIDCCTGARLPSDLQNRIVHFWNCVTAPSILKKS